MKAGLSKDKTNFARPEQYFAKALVHSEKERAFLKLEHLREVRQKMSMMQTMGKLWANWPCSMSEDDARRWSALLSCYDRADWGRVLTDSLIDVWSYENSVHGAGPENDSRKWDKIIDHVIEQLDLLKKSA